MHELRCVLVHILISLLLQGLTHFFCESHKLVLVFEVCNEVLLHFCQHPLPPFQVIHLFLFRQQVEGVRGIGKLADDQGLPVGIHLRDLCGLRVYVRDALVKALLRDFEPELLFQHKVLQALVLPEVPVIEQKVQVALQVLDPVQHLFFRKGHDPIRYVERHVLGRQLRNEEADVLALPSHVLLQHLKLRVAP